MTIEREEKKLAWLKKTLTKKERIGILKRNDSKAKREAELYKKSIRSSV